ncbi:hypothetical protein PUN28_006515 [Cardiocondyla obscurior]|uniref:Uncharacterized protein n=1 Tax=Cardiocondyla obscurior TaxID=286306 RepID=A0AAW2G9L7_9HYME
MVGLSGLLGSAESLFAAGRSMLVPSGAESSDLPDVIEPLRESQVIDRIDNCGAGDYNVHRCYQIFNDEMPNVLRKVIEWHWQTSKR